MSVLVRFGHRKAILRLGNWFSADSELEAQLNALTAAWFQEAGGPPISEPDQEKAVAEEISRRMGGRVGLHVRANSRKATRSYMDRRQMELDFRGNSR